MQRKDDKPGRGLGKTTGWIHRLNLKRRGIHAWSGVTYRRVDDDGLHLSMGGEELVLAVDHIVVCAGQVENRDLSIRLEAAGVAHHVIGGARQARELDAKHAIREGFELATRL